jgi:hypothetical protein
MFVTGRVITLGAMPDPVPLEYSSGEGRVRVWMRRFAALLVLFPVLLLACVYGGWLVAWASLGRRPDPVGDNPAYVDWPAYAAAVELMTAVAWVVFVVHLALVGAAFYPSLTPGNPAWKKAAVLAAAVAPWAAAFVLLNADPGAVMKGAGGEPP